MSSQEQHEPEHHQRANPLITTEQTSSSVFLRTSLPRSPNFMQPESPHLPNTENPQVAPENSTATSQHGLHHHDQQALLPSHSCEVQREPISVGRAGGSSYADVDAPDSGSDGADDAARLNPRTPSPKNKIAEYENASLNSGKKRADTPVFEVIKTVRKPDDKSCAIAKLPNGE